MTAVLRLPVPKPAELEPATVEAARRGESWAQALVVERYAKPVWSLVCRVLGRAGRRTWADDATQDALVAALRSLPRFRTEGPTSLTSWVLTIAARTAIDVLRRHRELVPVDEGASASQTVSEYRPDRSAEQRSLGRAIENAVEQLAPEIRATFVLRAYHELEYAEIAEALAVDLGTVKSRIWRARAALKDLLAEVRRDE